MSDTSDDTERAKKIIISATELLGGKSNDYGGPREAFGNAAKIASVIRGKEISALDVAGVMIGIKLCRLGNLTREDGPKPKYDSIIDVVLDAINYIGLYESLREDVEDAKVKCIN